MPLTSEATRIGQLVLAGAAAASVDISIVIPTRNRIASIEKTLQRCLALRPKPTEIVIVDDYSDDNCSEALRRLETGIVKYIRLPSNEGQSLARSVGFATARSKYLVSLDDDSWFLEPDALGRIWDRLESSPNVGILALRGFSPLDPIQAPAERRSLVADHITCGAAYRAAVLHKTGYHLAFLRYEGEETDLNLKIIDAGFDVVLDESIRFFHEYDPRSRTADALARVRRLAVRNDLLRSWIYFPVDLALATTVWRAMSHLAWGIRHGAIVSTLRGYLEFVLWFPRAVKRRRPIRRAAAFKYLTLRRRPQLLQDVQR